MILYLVKAHDLLSRDQATLDRIEADAALISAWLEERKSEKLGDARVVIVGTHADMDGRFTTIKPEDFEEQFGRNENIRRMVLRFGGTGTTLVVLGSLKTIDTAKRMVYTLFAKLAAS